MRVHATLWMNAFIFQYALRIIQRLMFLVKDLYIFYEKKRKFIYDCYSNVFYRNIWTMF